jgi:two-component sensor histidine kinase
MVQSIASQTLRRAPNPGDFVTNFTGRIQALARVHSGLSEQTWRGAELSRLIVDQLLLGGPTNDRILLDGPALMLEPQVALHIALMVYELGTNARKHGALSAAQGVLRVVWEVRSDNGRRSLHLTWSERGGPKVVAPERAGFGTRLVEQSLDAHQGAARLRFAREGLTCEIELPLPPPLAITATRRPRAEPPSGTAPITGERAAFGDFMA